MKKVLSSVMLVTLVMLFMVIPNENEVSASSCGISSATHVDDTMVNPEPCTGGSSGGGSSLGGYVSPYDNSSWDDYGCTLWKAIWNSGVCYEIVLDGYAPDWIYAMAGYGVDYFTDGYTGSKD